MGLSSPHTVGVFDDHVKCASFPSQPDLCLSSQCSHPRVRDTRHLSRFPCALRVRVCGLAPRIEAPPQSSQLPAARLRSPSQVRMAVSSQHLNQSCRPNSLTFGITLLIGTQTPGVTSYCSFVAFLTNVRPTHHPENSFLSTLVSMQLSLMFSAGMFFCMALNLQ